MCVLCCAIYNLTYALILTDLTVLRSYNLQIFSHVGEIQFKPWFQNGAGALK